MLTLLVVCAIVAVGVFLAASLLKKEDSSPKVDPKPDEEKK